MRPHDRHTPEPCDSDACCAGPRQLVPVLDRARGEALRIPALHLAGPVALRPRTRAGTSALRTSRASLWQGRRGRARVSPRSTWKRSAEPLTSLGRTRTPPRGAFPSPKPSCSESGCACLMSEALPASHLQASPRSQIQPSGGERGREEGARPPPRRREGSSAPHGRRQHTAARTAGAAVPGRPQQRLQSSRNGVAGSNRVAGRTGRCQHTGITAGASPCRGASERA